MRSVQLSTDSFAAYRNLLQAFLEIPIQATDLAIHNQIQARLPPALLKKLVDAGLFSREACETIISFTALNVRLRRHQLLSVNESDRLFRVARVTALAEVAFGSREKALRWLNAPKRHFLGTSPVGMLSTIVGAYLVEEMLSQLTEGYVL